MRALIVDDSSFIRDYLRQLLHPMGITCEEAVDGNDALMMLAAQTFDLMLLDVNMPVMNGLECVKALRKAHLGPEMKVMMVTTEADNSFISAALENGADEFLMKPFTPESLREKMALLGFAAAEQEIERYRAMGISSEQPIRVLAVDDSAVMRGVMRKLFAMHSEDRLSRLPPMELCGVAQDGVECLDLVGRLRPDVLVLDLAMPRLNGLDVLDRLRDASPGLPVIMCSSYTERGARSTLEALARGAADYVMKPSEQRDLAMALQSLAEQLLPKIAALAKCRRRKSEGGFAEAAQSARAEESSERRGAPIEVVVIGLSTGGPSALEQMLPRLPHDFPVPVLIVQHMPKLFTGALAERLDKCCALRVAQAYDSAAILPGTIWLAPGDSHMEVAPRKRGFGIGDGEARGRATRVKLHQQELLNHCRPSVDYLFHSAARIYGAGTLALMMTGMGADGLEGARAVHGAGGVVLAQDEATSAVWGMPGRVAEAGIASAILPLAAIAGELKQRVNASRALRQASGDHTATVAVSRRERIHGLL